MSRSPGNWRSASCAIGREYGGQHSSSVSPCPPAATSGPASVTGKNVGRVWWSSDGSPWRAGRGCFGSPKSERSRTVLATGAVFRASGAVVVTDAVVEARVGVGGVAVASGGAGGLRRLLGGRGPARGGRRLPGGRGRAPRGRRDGGRGLGRGGRQLDGRG